MFNDARPTPTPLGVIADDSPTLRRIVAGVLSAPGFEVVPAEDGVEAVQAVFRTQPDAVVLDVQMPRVSGYVAARRAQGRLADRGHPGLILLTSLGRGERPLLGRAGRRRPFLTKDFEAPELVEAVRRGHRGGRRGAAAAGRGSSPDPVELSDDDVLSRVCDLLDRKLFEASVAAGRHGDRGGRARLRGDGRGGARGARQHRRLRPRSVLLLEQPGPTRRTCRWPGSHRSRSTASSSRASPTPPTQSTGAPTPVTALDAARGRPGRHSAVDPDD